MAEKKTTNSENQNILVAGILKKLSIRKIKIFSHQAILPRWLVGQRPRGGRIQPQPKFNKVNGFGHIRIIPEDILTEFGDNRKKTLS